jgi:hypothetical protein
VDRSWDSLEEALNDLGRAGWKIETPIYGPVPGRGHEGETWLEALVLVKEVVDVDEILAALRGGTLTQVHEALSALREDPSLITDEVLDELAEFVVSVLRRIYRYWNAREEPQAIPLSKWGGFADPTDDEDLFKKGLSTLAQVAPDVNEIADRWKSPGLFTLGGRLTRRIDEVCPYLKTVIEDLSRSSCASVAKAAQRLADEVATGSV